MSHQGSCSSEPAGDLAEVLMLDGAFDRSNAAQVELALGDAIDADKPQLVIDLRGVSFLDSTTLGVLIQGLRDTAARGRQLALIRPQCDGMESVRAHRPQSQLRFVRPLG
jgi:anti-anti-sigma factor